MSVVETVVVKLGNEMYGLPVSNVQSIEKPMSVTKIPGSSRENLGLVDYRDQICSLYDLGIVLGMDQVEELDSTRDVFIVLASGQVVGLRVDEVIEVTELAEFDGNESGDYHLNFLESYLSVSRHGDTFVLLIDVNEMLDRSRNVFGDDVIVGVTKDERDDVEVEIEKVKFTN